MFDSPEDRSRTPRVPRVQLLAGWLNHAIRLGAVELGRGVGVEAARAVFRRWANPGCLNVRVATKVYPACPFGVVVGVWGVW